MVTEFCHGANQAEGLVMTTRSADTVTVNELRRADAFVIATPENFGYMAGTIKAFFDRTFYACMSDTTPAGGGSVSQLAGRPYSVLVCAGNDGIGAMQSVDRIIAGWRMRKVHPGIIARRLGGEAGSSRGALREEDLSACRELGEMFAEGLVMGAL